MLAYNKLGRFIGRLIVQAGNKVKDIEIKMKTAHLPDVENTLLKSPLWSGTHTYKELVIIRQNNGPQRCAQPNAQNVLRLHSKRELRL